MFKLHISPYEAKGKVVPVLN